MAMIIFIFLFTLESSFLKAMECTQEDLPNQPHETTSHPQTYEKVRLSNFATALSTSLACWTNSEEDVEFTAITASA